MGFYPLQVVVFKKQLKSIFVVFRMKAICFQEARSVSLQECPVPGIEDTSDVIVKVHLSSLCGSDLHVYRGCETTDKGTIMGHEFVGEVVTTGEDVRCFEIGDRVICPFTTSCGKCFFCENQLSCRCIHSQLFGFRSNGVGLHGVQAEYVRVPLADGTLIKSPKGVSIEKSVLLADVSALYI